ncbi:unnamed protein product [Calypogeia fissa]
MALASTSCHFLDQPSSNDKQIMVHMNDKLCNDSSLLSSTFFEDFDYDAGSSSTPLVSEEDLQGWFTVTGNRIFAPEMTALSLGASALSTEAAHIMQGMEGSYPANQHVPTAHESFGSRLSDENGSLGFNQLPGVGGDVRLYSQEMPTYAALQHQKLGWNEASTSSTTTGDPMTTTISNELGRPSEQRDSSCPMSTSTALEAFNLECHRPHHYEINHLPSPGATSLTSVDLDLTFGSSWNFKWEPDTALPPKSSHQRKRSIFSPDKPTIRQKSRFHSVSMARSRMQDASRVEHCRNAVGDSQVTLGSLEHNFPQQGIGLSLSSSTDLHRPHQTGEFGIGGELDPRKLKQKAEQQSFAPRKYQRRRTVSGNVIKDEVMSRRTTLDNVERERKRRDLMTTKIAALDLLLPRSAKRDRVAIVYDAIQLLKILERDIKDLQKKFHETKLRRAGLPPSAMHRQPLHPVTINCTKSTGFLRKPIDCNMRTTGDCFSNEVVIKHTGIYMKPIDILTLSTEGTTRGTTEESRPTQRPSFQCLGASNIPDKGNVFVEFHVHLKDNVKVHEEKLLKCRCRKDYLSTMMGLVDEFQLDIVSCNVVKMSSYFICFTSLKVLTTTKSTTAAQFAFRLQSAVDLDIYESPGKQLQSVYLGQRSPIDSVDK